MAPARERRTARAHPRAHAPTDELGSCSSRPRGHFESLGARKQKEAPRCPGTAHFIRLCYKSNRAPFRAEKRARGPPLRSRGADPSRPRSPVNFTPRFRPASRGCSRALIRPLPRYPTMSDRRGARMQIVSRVDGSCGDGCARPEIRAGRLRTMASEANSDFRSVP